MRLNDLLKFLIPLYVSEGKSYLTIAIGCTGGRHRSVMIAEALRKTLERCCLNRGFACTIETSRMNRRHGVQSPKSRVQCLESKKVRRILERH